MLRAMMDGTNITNRKSVKELMQSSVRLRLPEQTKALEDALESQEFKFLAKAA